MGPADPSERRLEARSPPPAASAPRARISWLEPVFLSAGGPDGTATVTGVTDDGLFVSGQMVTFRPGTEGWVMVAAGSRGFLDESNAREELQFRSYLHSRVGHNPTTIGFPGTTTPGLEYGLFVFPVSTVFGDLEGEFGYTISVVCAHGAEC